MVETQNRGTLHIHLLLWIKGAPNATDLFSELNASLEFQTKIHDYLTSVIDTGMDTEIKHCDCILESSCQHWSTNPFMEEIQTSDSKDFRSYVLRCKQWAEKDFQLHKHTHSCTKIKSVKTCRFNKPSPEVLCGKWNQETGYKNSINIK